MDYSKAWISQAGLDRILAACPAEHRASVRANVSVYPPARGGDWDWLNEPVDVGAAWDLLIDAEQLREYRFRAFLLCVRGGGCDTRVRDLDQETFVEFGRRWREAFAQVGARQNGKRILMDRFLEECRARNIPVTVASAMKPAAAEPEPEPAGVDVYMPSAWLDGPSFFERLIEREARRAYEDERRLWLNRYQPQPYFQWRGGNPVEDYRRFLEASRASWPEPAAQEPGDRYFRRDE